MAESDFPLIAVTPVTPVADEGAKIAAILDAGWWRVHLRHPEASAAELTAVIKSIPQRVRDRVTMHDRHSLAQIHGIGGLQLNARNPMPPYGWRGMLSRSCHNMRDVARSAVMHYITLSPVMDSISKPGYRGVEFAHLPTGVRIIALGGITPANLTDMRRRGFGGAAMLGAVPWEKDIEEITRFATNTLDIIC